MKETQLLLFYEPTETKMQREIDELREQLGNVRRGLFKRHQEMGKLVLELRAEIDMLKDLKAKESKIIEMELYGWAYQEQ